MNVKRSAPLSLPSQIHNAASSWFIAFHEEAVDATKAAEFIRWLRASPQHVQAYLQAVATWEDAARIRQTHRESVDELLALARANKEAIPLVPDSGDLPRCGIANRPTATSIGPQSRALGFRKMALAIAAAVLVAIAGLTWFTLEQYGLYTTSIGEQRSMRLADGSTVDLNSRSRVRVSFKEKVREVDLLDGQALFRVAKDPARPFIVRSGDTVVRAVGTQFDVYRRKSGTTVTVLEGRVAVSSTGSRTAGKSAASSTPAIDTAAHPPTGASTFLSAGEQVTLTTTELSVPKPANLATATAWTQRQIVFEKTPLTEVVEEFNRYNDRHMVIVDPSVGGIRISGVFSSVDPGSLINGLRALQSFSVHERDGEIQISRR
jgi:transmembrane sensor